MCGRSHVQNNAIYLSLSIKHKDLTRKSCVFIYFIDSMMKIVLYLHFLYTKDDRHRKIKKKHEWWNNRFSDVFRYRLNLKHFTSLLFLTQDNSDNFIFQIKSLFFFQPWLLNKAVLFLKKYFDYNISNNEKRKQYKQKQFWHF